jgi:hypothetical protein
MTLPTCQSGSKARLNRETARRTFNFTAIESGSFGEVVKVNVEVLSRLERLELIEIGVALNNRADRISLEGAHS